ncbi:hypothetical protein LX36DRAFT_15776 [Colletotrichum falcatum]|nr:hypothetical protein LX36DRAFT_15776 [Colletotrichum falcatum]
MVLVAATLATPISLLGLLRFRLLYVYVSASLELRDGITWGKYLLSGCRQPVASDTGRESANNTVPGSSICIVAPCKAMICSDHGRWQDRSLPQYTYSKMLWRTWSKYCSGWRWRTLGHRCAAPSNTNRILTVRWIWPCSNTSGMQRRTVARRVGVNSVANGNKLCPTATDRSGTEGDLSGWHHGHRLPPGRSLTVLGFSSPHTPSQMPLCSIERRSCHLGPSLCHRSNLYVFGICSACDPAIPGFDFRIPRGQVRYTSIEWSRGESSSRRWKKDLHKHQP